MSSLHIHCPALLISTLLESVGAKSWPKDHCPHLLFPVFASLPSSLSTSTSLPSFLLCQEASQKLVAAVRLVLLPSQSPSYFPASSQLFAASTSGVSNSTRHSCLQLHGQTSQVLTGHSHTILFLRSHQQAFPLQNRYSSCS